jgi:hypothetical protein
MVYLFPFLVHFMTIWYLCNCHMVYLLPVWYVVRRQIWQPRVLVAGMNGGHRRRQSRESTGAAAAAGDYGCDSTVLKRGRGAR